jgi:hypothetical protein
MRHLLSAFLALTVVSTTAFAIPVYSIDDPSLQGMEVASGHVSIFIPGIPDGGPGPMAYSVDEKVVQNSAGFLDFYYRFSPLSGEVVQLNSLSIGSISYVNSLAYVGDGPGDSVPYYGQFEGAGIPTSKPYVSFTFGYTDNLGNYIPAIVGAEGTNYLLLRSSTDAYSSDGFISTSTNEGGFSESQGAFIPAPPVVPEPASVLLIPVGLIALTWRFRLA